MSPLRLLVVVSLAGLPPFLGQVRVAGAQAPQEPASDEPAPTEPASTTSTSVIAPAAPPPQPGGADPSSTPPTDVEDSQAEVVEQAPPPADRSVDDSAGPTSGTSTSNAEAAPPSVKAGVAPTRTAKAPLQKSRIDYSKRPWTYHLKRFDLGVGYARTWRTDSTYEAFASDASRPTLDAHAALTLFSMGRLSAAVTVGYETRASTGEVRGTATFLREHRAVAGLEGRFHFFSRLYGYGAFDVGGGFVRSTLGEEGDGVSFAVSRTLMTGTASLGSSLRVLGSANGTVRAPRAHVYLEGGLSFSSKANLTYTVSDQSILRAEPIEFGSVHLGGPRVAIGTMVSF